VINTTSAKAPLNNDSPAILVFIGLYLAAVLTYLRP
jgi:hypothetical protein